MWGLLPARSRSTFTLRRGAPTEWQFFAAPARACGLRLLCLDRFALDAALNGPAYFAALAEAVRAVAQGRQVHVIGFSIGAFVVLHISRLLGAQVGQLHLVSAAAPLQSGHFLPGMAGRAVFQAAMATCLQHVMPNCRAVNWLQGQSHCSCLYRAAPHICQQLARSCESGESSESSESSESGQQGHVAVARARVGGNSGDGPGAGAV
jgi:pimeloyl-ACP methyl ester carboxylesterase